MIQKVQKVASMGFWEGVKKRKYVLSETQVRLE